MKRLILIILLFQLAVLGAAAQHKCAVCHGGGQIQTRYKVSGFGTQDHYIKCPRCGQNILSRENHWDTCPTCKGSGTRPGPGGEDNLPGSYDLLKYLTPQEYALYDYLNETLKEIYYVYDACYACKGSGRCHVCGGSGFTSTGAGCFVCQESGFCITCNGTGYSGKHPEKAPYHDNFERIKNGLLIEAAARLKAESGKGTR